MVSRMVYNALKRSNNSVMAVSLYCVFTNLIFIPVIFEGTFIAYILKNVPALLITYCIIKVASPLFSYQRVIGNMENE